jgi:TRAP-type uncharacterized transport system substrate-binding protein
MLEAASELVRTPDWEEKQVEINFRVQGDRGWKYRFFASDAPESVEEVRSGRADLAICNPGAVLAMALHGTGPFKEPVPVRAILVLPQFDQIGFAVKVDTGIESFADIRDRKYPLRVSLRGQKDHSVLLMIDQVLATYGFTLDDIRSWGGEIRYDPGMPNLPHRLGAAERGEVDAIWDEALHIFGNEALAAGMRFIPVDEPQLQELEAVGQHRAVIEKRLFPALPADVWTVDFSGWPVFCLDSTPDQIVTAFCAAVDARKANIPWYGDGPLDLQRMVSDTADAPLPIPMHPAARAYWEKAGYI